MNVTNMQTNHTKRVVQYIALTKLKNSIFSHISLFRLGLFSATIMYVLYSRTYTTNYYRARGLVSKRPPIHTGHNEFVNYNEILPLVTYVHISIISIISILTGSL